MMKLKAPPPPVTLAEWREQSHIAKIRPLAVRWAEYGADTPGFIHIFYVLKMALYIWGGLAIIAATPGFGGIGDLASWWAEPVVYQKIVAYTCRSSNLWVTRRASERSRRGVGMFIICGSYSRQGGARCPIPTRSCGWMLLGRHTAR